MKLTSRKTVKPLPLRALWAVLACVLVATLAMPISAFAALKTNYDWYKGHESDAIYTIGTAGEMKALAALVNGTASYDADGDGAADAIPAVSFEGKTVALSEGLPVNFMREAIEPIGTAEHPFQGTFDGTARQVDNFVLAIGEDSTASVQNIGLFGYVGEQGSLIGVSVGPNSSISIVRNAESSNYVANIGMVAGYCGGTMTACSNAGTLSIDSAVVQKSKEEYLPVRNVGGVAGVCVFDMANCANTGTICVSETSAPVPSFDNSMIAGRIGGVVGLFGDEERIGTYEKHIYGEAAKHGTLSSCSNTGRITIDTPKLSGLDRFGQQTNAQSVYVGGVAGYSQGSIVDCTNGQAQSEELGSDGRNVGYINAKNGCMVGGICGSLRGVVEDNVHSAWADDGADGNDPIVVSNCTNYGDIYACAGAGGIAGKSGSYTTITECLNATKRDSFGNEVPTYIVATRWNKPCPGGIAGYAQGEVSYCANFGTVASALWADEATRTLTTMDGYYAAGIVGMLTYFGDQAPSHGGVTTPIAEVFSCYNAGEIIAGSNMRQRGIVGENDGYVHSNVLVAGLVYNDEIVYGDSIEENEASGAVGENRVYEAIDLRGAKAAEAVAFMNGTSETNGWQRYWILPRDATRKGLNAGYPLLDSQNPWGDAAISIVDASTSLVSNAAYTGGESVPSVSVSLNGVQLTENADFRVVPQKDAIMPSTGKAYSATVVGLGRYFGTASNTVPYDIVAGDFSKCTLTVTAHTFDYEKHVPAQSDVTVRTPAGTTVDPDEYTFKLVDEVGDEIEAPTDADIYQLVAVPKEGSTLFSGEKKGTFRIKPASFVRDVELDDVKITYQGKDYPWKDSMDKGESDNPSTVLRYTGAPVKPTVGAITYKGHTLVEGKDYRIVYGNANSDDGYTGDQDANNMGKKGGTTIGCVTIRNITGTKTNYTSYANMFFSIVDDGKATDLALTTWPDEDVEQVADGEPLAPVELWLDRTRLTEGVDYTIEYENNVEPGTALYMATGIGGFTGTKTGSFTIVGKSGYDLEYAFAGTGAADDPYEATVTGVVYTGTRDTFSLVIPDSVEHEGNEYTVTAIGDSAFGGARASDFSGSPENESKMRISSVFIPASVRIIGNYAFGTGSLTMVNTPPVATVEFGAGSQLRSIGQYAFAKCKNLASFTVPASVDEIGNNAFFECSALSEIRFLTEDATLPSTLYAKTFGSCSGVLVRGFDTATAVKQIAIDNSGDSIGKNGGRNFTFKALASISKATMSTPADQVYTGAALKPKVSVSMNGVRLTEGVDYQIVYENNANAGTARVVAYGIGDKGGQVSRTFAIAPAEIGRASSDRIADVAFTGEPVEVQLDLLFNGRVLVVGKDYEVSYADLAGNALAAPSAAGSYRLVAIGKGNFKGSMYRAFRIVAPSIADAAIVNIGAKPYAGGSAIEPEVNVKLGGVDLVRDRDFTVAYENNTQIGEATAHIYGIGGYEGEAEAKFPIVEAEITGAAVAGVADVQATGEAVAFDPVVVVDGVRLNAGDYSISYAKRVDPSNEDNADASASDNANAADKSLPLSVGSQADKEPKYEPLDAAPSEPGDYKLILTAKGSQYAGTAERTFSIVEDAPESHSSIETAIIAGIPDQVYTGCSCKPQLSVSLDGVALIEGVDYIAAYAGNIEPGKAVAAVFGIGAYEGSATAEFTVVGGAITAECVERIADVEYTGAAVSPHPVVRIAGHTLSEGVDYTVDYKNNTKVTTDSNKATCTISAARAGYSGSTTVSFGIVRADVSRAVVTLSSDKATFTGKAIEPKVTVVFGGRTLSEGKDYQAVFADNVDPGTACVTIAGLGSYIGQTVARFTIVPIEIARPTAKMGLVYTGSPQAGVASNASYVLTGATATNAGTYTAEAVLRTGYTWTGGFTAPVKLEWSIAQASLSKAKVTLKMTSAAYNGKTQKGAVKSVVVGKRTLTTADYSVSAASGKKVGSYKVAIAGKGNYVGAASATFSIVKAANPLKASGKTIKLKASSLKKKNQTITVKKAFSVTKNQGKVTYKKTSGNKKIIVGSAGKVTVKKGLGKGTYKVKVTVTAAGNSSYKKGAKTATVTIKVS